MGIIHFRVFAMWATVMHVSSWRSWGVLGGFLGFLDAPRGSRAVLGVPRRVPVEPWRGVLGVLERWPLQFLGVPLVVLGVLGVS